MISFVLLFAVAFAQLPLPNNKAECEKLEGAEWAKKNETSTEFVCKCLDTFEQSKFEVKCVCSNNTYNPINQTDGKLKCQPCATNNYYHVWTKKCVTSCPEGSEIKNGKCQCKTDSRYYNAGDNKCYKDCPAGVWGDDNDICRKCDKPGEMIDNVYHICRTSCPDYFVNVTNECKPCSNTTDTKNYNPITQKCVKTCPEGMEPQPKEDPSAQAITNVCRCKAATPVIDINGTKCIKECGYRETKAQRGTNITQCVGCPDAAVWVPSKKDCEDRCPDGFIADDKNECHKNCLNEDVNQYSYNDTCVKECPSLYGPYTKNICKKCSEIKTHPLYDEKAKKCVEKCPTGTTAKDGICKSNNGVNGLFLVLAMALFFIF